MTQPETLPLEFDDSPGEIVIGDRAVVLRGFARDHAIKLIAGIAEVAAVSPFRHMVTPGGWEMSVALTNCGPCGWVTDRTGYRYDPMDPDTGQPWPPLPAPFSELAFEAAQRAGFRDFRPDACLVNRYAPGARLSLHQDCNEQHFGQPIVSVSLGLPAVFLWGGHKRTDKVQRIPLHHGDVAVWGGPDRLRFHGVNALPEGDHPLTGQYRYNFTFRRAR
jgi:alkylated DNA repair protein (DNA oxidative demethylase)